MWFKTSQEYRNLDRIDGEPMEIEWNIFPGFITLQLSQEVKRLLLRLNETPENFYRKDHLHVDVQRHLMGIKRQQDRMRVKCSTRFSICKKIWIRKRSFLGPGSERKWYSISDDSPQGEWDRMAGKFMLEFGESKHPVFRATSPLSRGQLKSKSGGNLSIHCCANQDTIQTVFRAITSVNQLSLYGAVEEMCEEYESFHDRTGKPVVRGQSSSSFVPSVIKTDVLLDNDDRAHKDLLLQRYGERVEKLSQQDKLSTSCFGSMIPRCC